MRSQRFGHDLATLTIAMRRKSGQGQGAHKGQSIFTLALSQDPVSPLYR